MLQKGGCKVPAYYCITGQLTGAGGTVQIQAQYCEAHAIKSAMESTPSIQSLLTAPLSLQKVLNAEKASGNPALNHRPLSLHLVW